MLSNVKVLLKLFLVMLIAQPCFANESITKTETNIDKSMTEECRAFAADSNADLGEVLNAGCEPSLEQMSKLMDNPVGNVAMLFTQIDVINLKNDATGGEGTQSVYTGIAQFPKKLNKNWNLINRVIWTVPSSPLDQDKINDLGGGDIGQIPPGAVIPPDNIPVPIDLIGGRTTGFGDMYYVGLFAPDKPTKLDNGANLLWGLGFDLGFPTATEDVLGTGKYLAGPSFLGAYMGETWKYGALGMHYWDFAGDANRSDVNLTNLQYFVYYDIDGLSAIGAGPNIMINWEMDRDNAYTVPVGIGYNRTFELGKVPVRIGAEIYYSVIMPDDIPGAEWNFRLFIVPAVPSALFSWMN